MFNFVILNKKDNPVGTGFSYVENKKLVVKSDEEAGEDLTRLLIELFNKNIKLQKSPLYIVAESYGGKFAVTLGLAAHQAIQSGQLNLKLGGILLFYHYKILLSNLSHEIYLTFYFSRFH